MDSLDWLDLHVVSMGYRAGCLDTAMDEVQPEPHLIGCLMQVSENC